MNLFNIFPKIGGTKEKTAQSYLALVLTPDRVLSLIWDFTGEQIRNLGFGKKSYQNIDVLIHQAAVVIDMAGEQAKVDVSKVVFGLSADWFEDSEITKDTAKLLKKLSEELDLDPDAFVPLPSAINHLLKTEESVTPNAILIGIFNDFCEVHLLENNKVKETKTSKAQINIEKITKLVAGFKEEVEKLPAKIIVYGQNEMSELSEKINKNDWGDIFVHAPKIEFLDDNELVRSVAYAHAADILGFEPSGDGKIPIAQELHVEPNPEPRNVNELGFVEGEDILKTKEEVPETPIEETGQHPRGEIGTHLRGAPGSVEAHLGGEKSYPGGEQGTMEESNVLPPPLPRQEDLPETHSQKRFNPVTFILGIMPDPTALLNFKSGKRIWMIAGAVLFLILIAGFIVSFTLTKAEVIIKVEPKSQEGNFTAQVVENGSADPQKSQLSGNFVSQTADGSQKAVTTGSKKVGDSAKGEVNVFNWTTAPKTFTKGTGLITSAGLKFKLDSDIEIASRSASTPGQGKTNAIAQEVGTGGNIAGGVDLTFQQFDAISYSAQTAAAFSGGSERQSTVVTKDDMDRLEKSLTDTLTQKAKDDLKNKAQAKKLENNAEAVKITKKQFDKNLDEEAAVLNLDMQIEVNAIVYDEVELKKLLAQTLKGNIPDNLEARPENIDIAGLSVTRLQSTLKLSGKIKAALVPKFNEDDIKQKIIGKSVKSARAAILATGQAADVQINFSPNLPFILSLPRDKSKITFKIETN